MVKGKILRKPHVVQRLSLPQVRYIDDHIEGFINPYGNILNDINNESAQKACALVFQPDYMGAAEYEWGKLPKTMHQMWEKTKSYTILLNIPDKNIKYKIYIVITDDNHYDNESQLSTYLEWLYLEGKKGEEVAKNDFGSFYKAVNKIHSINKDTLTLGWFALDDQFAFFINKQMAENFNKLFTITGLEELHRYAKLIHKERDNAKQTSQN